jgi:hypothetical protein
MTAEQLISFARGAPSLDIVDVDGLSAAAVRAFAEDPGGITAYGNSYGYAPLRKWIAQKHNVSVDQVLITNGSLQADAFLFDYLLKPGDHVVVEKPTYDRTLLGLRNRGAVVHQVTLNADGVDTAELRSLLESGSAPSSRTSSRTSRTRPGVTLSLAGRRDLLTLAKEFGFVLFEDDPYADIRFRGESLPSMLSMDDSGVVVHASSFTKTVCPGVAWATSWTGADDRRHRQGRHQPLHLRRARWPRDGAPVLRFRSDRTFHRDGQGRVGATFHAAGGVVAATHPGHRFTEPTEAISSGSSFRQMCTWTSSCRPRWSVGGGREGFRFPPRRRRALVAPGLQRGDRGPDRRRCTPVG